MKFDLRIIDPIANGHVNFSLHSIGLYFIIRLINVYMPDDFSIIIVTFSPRLYLTNELYTLDFSLNSMSVSKLCLLL